MHETFPNSMSHGGDGNEEVAELVVTALGTSGTHYICWKTHLGEYRQRSQGLPTQLQEWLFPSDGTTRDFATLQVILLGNGAFWASDKDGEIRDDDPRALKQLRRSLTFNGNSLSSTHQRRLSRGRDLEQNLERPRSSTLPATLSRENTIARRQLIPLLSHSRAPSLDRSRLGPAVPVAVRRQGRVSPIRPRSIDTTTVHGELGVLKEQPTPRSSAALPNNFESLNSTPEYHSYRRQEEIDVRRTQLTPTPTTYHRPQYADASTQTEPQPKPTVAPNHEGQGCKCQVRDHNAQRDSAVSFGLSTKSYTDSRRSSIDTPITRPDSGWFESSWPPPPTMNANPIVMGRMQDYFRSTTYVLGAALRPQGMG